MKRCGLGTKLFQLCRRICSTHFGNLHNFEIALHILSIAKLCADFEIAYAISKSCNESTAQFRNGMFLSKIHASVGYVAQKTTCSHNIFQLASCSRRTHTPLNVIIALRWTPRVLNSKQNIGSCCSAMTGGSLAHISLWILIYLWKRGFARTPFLHAWESKALVFTERNTSRTI